MSLQWGWTAAPLDVKRAQSNKLAVRLVFPRNRALLRPQYPSVLLTNWAVTVAEALVGKESVMLGPCVATITGTRELRREASSNPLASCCLISFLNTFSGMDSFAWALMEDTKMFKVFQHFCQSPFRTPFLLLQAPDLWVKLYTTPGSLRLYYRPLFPSHNGWVYAYTFASGDAPCALVIMSRSPFPLPTFPAMHLWTRMSPFCLHQLVIENPPGGYRYGLEKNLLVPQKWAIW